MGKIFFKECQIHKTNQYDGLSVIADFKLGTDLYLYLDKDDIQVRYKSSEGEDFIIGVLPKEEQEPINLFLKAAQQGENKACALFLCKVSKIDEKADENKRISIAVFINI